MDITEAAAYVGLTEEELLRSYYRGLPPGHLARKLGRDLFFDPADLEPCRAKPAAQSVADMSRADLVRLAQLGGYPVRPRATKAEILAMLDDAQE